MKQIGGNAMVIQIDKLKKLTIMSHIISLLAIDGQIREIYETVNILIRQLEALKKIDAEAGADTLEQVKQTLNEVW